MAVSNRRVGVIEVDIATVGVAAAAVMHTIPNPEKRVLLISALVLEALTSTADEEEATAWLVVRLPSSPALDREFELNHPSVLTTPVVAVSAFGASARRWGAAESLQVVYKTGSAALTFTGRLYIEYYSGPISRDADHPK